MENKTAEEIDVYELAERLMASQSIEASVSLIKEFAEQERLKGIDVYAIDIQKLRATATDAEFRRLLTQYLK